MIILIFHIILYDILNNIVNAKSNNVDKSDKIQLKNMNISFEIQQQPDSIYIIRFIMIKLNFLKKLINN